MDRNELILIVWAIPLAESLGKMVNYWMQKREPALMDVEWDNQEANDNRKICQTEQQWKALYLAVDIQNTSITNYTRAFICADLQFYVPSGSMNVSQHKGPLLDPQLRIRLQLDSLP